MQHFLSYLDYFMDAIILLGLINDVIKLRKKSEHI